ncbi:MAG: SAM-dependent methyltransferase [Burkholderiales bacterium]|nr:SAM-dependent methyltransferase [Burkholderiales bacterium]
MTPGVLYLIPATLADPKGGPDAALIASSLPPGTLAVLARLEAFAVENAKSARAFLKAVSPLPLQRLVLTEIGHAPDRAVLAPLIDALRRGQDVGLLSESGCPAVADPGALLVRMAHDAGLSVAPLVGPSAILLALMASGLEGQRFAFGGYLPIKPDERRTAIRALETRSAANRETQIAIETPYRNAALFGALLAALKPSTRLSVALDLTLASQSIRTMTVQQWRTAPEPPLDRRQAVFLLLAA